MDKIIHRFEEAGLGVAPFEFSHSTWNESWNSCNYCGHEIKEECWIKDANGKLFIVGNECVNKTGDEGLINVAKEKIKELRKKLRHERDAKKIEDARLLLYWMPELVDYIDQSTDIYYTKKTLEDFIYERMRYGGVSHKLDMCKKIWATATEFFKDGNIVEYFADHRENALWKYNEERRLERIRLEAEAEERRKQALARQEEERVRREQIHEENKPLIAVLEEIFQSPFVTDMISKLKYKEIKDFSPRQVEVLSDIYGKSFGKRGSEEYTQAYNELYRKSLVK